MWPFKKRTKKIIPFIKIVAICFDGTEIKWDRELPDRDCFYDLKKKINDDFRNQSICRIDIPTMDDTYQLRMDQVQCIAVSLVEGVRYE